MGKGFGEVLFRFFVWDSAVSFDFMELSFLAKLARTGSPVLVLGESGTGKEACANALHALSGCGA